MKIICEYNKNNPRVFALIKSTQFRASVRMHNKQAHRLKINVGIYYYFI